MFSVYFMLLCTIFSMNATHTESLATSLCTSNVPDFAKKSMQHLAKALSNSTCLASQPAVIALLVSNSSDQIRAPWASRLKTTDALTPKKLSPPETRGQKECGVSQWSNLLIALSATTKELESFCQLYLYVATPARESGQSIWQAVSWPHTPLNIERVQTLLSVGLTGRCLPLFCMAQTVS